MLNHFFSKVVFSTVLPLLTLSISCAKKTGATFNSLVEPTLINAVKSLDASQQPLSASPSGETLISPSLPNLPSVPNNHDIKPADVKAVEVKPADVKAVDAKPTEVKAAEVKPVDAKPVDSKTNDTSIVGQVREAETIEKASTNASPAAHMTLSDEEINAIADAIIAKNSSHGESGNIDPAVVEKANEILSTEEGTTTEAKDANKEKLIDRIIKTITNKTSTQSNSGLSILGGINISDVNVSTTVNVNKPNSGNVNVDVDTNVHDVKGEIETHSSSSGVGTAASADSFFQKIRNAISNKFKK